MKKQRHEVENALAMVFAEARHECQDDGSMLILQLRRQLRHAKEEVDLLRQECRDLKQQQVGLQDQVQHMEASAVEPAPVQAVPSERQVDDAILDPADEVRLKRAETNAQEPCTGLLGYWLDKDNPGLIQQIEEGRIASSTGEDFHIIELSNTKVCFLDFQKNVLRGELVGNLLVWNDGAVWCRDLFDKMDADRDGLLAPGDIEQAWNDMLSFVCSTTDYVTAEQFDFFCQVPTPGLFARLDPDGSGIVTKAAFQDLFRSLAKGGESVTREDFKEVQAAAASCECGNFFKPDDSFCRWCGQEQAGNISCDGLLEDNSACGTVLTKYALSCPDCGKVHRFVPN